MLRVKHTVDIYIGKEKYTSQLFKVPMKTLGKQE